MSLYIFSPFVSLVTSVILFFGCFEIGKILFTKFKIHQSIESVSIPEFQYTTIGIVIISILIFPLVAFTGYAEIVLRSIAFILLDNLFIFNLCKYLEDQNLSSIIISDGKKILIEFAGAIFMDRKKIPIKR